MFLNPSLTLNNRISRVVLDTSNNELYVNGVRIANQNDINTLQDEIDNIQPGDPNVWINGDGITSTASQIPFTDSTPNGMVTDASFTYVNLGDPTLTIGAAVISSVNNNMKLESTDYILTTKDIYLQGTEDVQRYLTVGCTNQVDNVKTYVDINTADYICDNQLTTKTEWRNASGYYFDNTIYINNEPLDISGILQDISQNTTDISGLILDVSQNTTDISGLIQDVSQNTTDISGLILDVSQNTYDISQNTSNISTLQGQVTQNTLDISSNTIAISGNTTSINTINNKLNSSLYDYYVSAQSGSDLTGDGTLYNPWKTVSKAITVVNTLSADIAVVINLSAGTYTENISVTKNNVSISGANVISTTITGNILFDMLQGSSFYSVGLLSNLTNIGTIEHKNSTLYNNTLSISNVISATPNGKNNFIFQTTGLGLLGDCTMNNCVVYANADTTSILVNNSALFMVGCQIQNSPVLGNTIQNYVYVSGAGRFNAFGCSMYNASTSASVKSLIEVANTVAVTSSTTINNCILMFTAPASTTSGSIMTFSNSVSSNTVNFYNNYVKSNVSTGAPNNYIVLKTSSNVGSNVNFTFGNCIGGTVSHTVPATGYVTGWTKTTMNPVT